MLIMVVDDEALVLRGLIKCIQDVEPDAEIISFLKSKDAIEYAEKNDVDVAFLDINLREEQNGIALGKLLKKINPRINIIFCSGYEEYIWEAVQDVHCNGYILKPATRETVKREMENLRIPLDRKEIGKDEIFVRCFGSFEVFCKGEQVIFPSAKSKELMAYLIDRQGALCTNGEIEAVLWEDDNSHRAYRIKIKKELEETLKKYKIQHILKRPFGSIGISIANITCDYTQWLQNDPKGIRAFYGEYMEQYSWAEVTKAEILRKNVDI